MIKSAAYQARIKLRVRLRTESMQQAAIFIYALREALGPDPYPDTIRLDRKSDHNGNYRSTTKGY